MAHLAQHAAVGARDALDGQHAAVGVVALVHRRHAIGADILRRNLTVFDQLAQQGVVADKAAFAMADGDQVLVVDIALRKPRALVGSNARAHQHTLVAVHGVEGQRRVVGRDRADLAVGDKPQLDQRLEPVADAQRQAVALVQQAVDRVGHSRGAEERRDELGRTVRLVAAGETARQHQDLRGVQLAHQRFTALGHVGGGQVFQHQHMRVASGAAERARGVVFAVGAREHRDDDARRRQAHGGGDALEGVAAVRQRLHRLPGAAVREYRFELGFPDLLQRGQVQVLAARHQRIVDRRGAQKFTGARLQQLKDHRAVARLQQAVGVNVAVEVQAQAVAQAHFEQRFGHAAETGRGGGQDLAFFDHLLDDLINREQAADLGQAVLILRLEDDHGAAGFLELGAQHAARVAHGGGKADQRGRHVQPFKAAGHAVLAADGGDAQPHLRIQRAEQRRHRLAPALRLFAHVLKIFLEGQVHILVAEPGANQLGHALHHRQESAAVGVRLGQVGVEAPGHAAAGRRLAVHRQLGGHRHGGGQLVFAAVGHQHGRRADRRIEPLAQALLAADVEVADHRLHLFAKGVAGPGRGPAVSGFDVYTGVAFRAVGAQELARKINNGGAVPQLDHALFFRDGGDDGRFEVLLVGQGDEGRGVLGRYGHGHAFLAFADGQLGAVQTLVLFGHFVQINAQPVGQFADGDRHAARAEVVAALDHAAGVLAPEQALQFALDGGVAFLHFGAAGFEA